MDLIAILISMSALTAEFTLTDVYVAELVSTSELSGEIIE